MQCPVVLSKVDCMSKRTDLRVNDLVAKIARVTLKDTTRVLMALDAVVDFLEEDADDLLGEDFAVDRPSPENADACGNAFEDFQVWLENNDDSRWLEYLRSLD